MRSIARFEPVPGTFRLDPWRNMEDLWRAWRVRPGLSETLEVAEFRMDIDEDDKAYYLKADLPGVRKENIKVTVDGNLVTISAETKTEKEEKKGTAVYTERYHGKQERRFAIRHEVDEANAEAAYQDGVLSLTLPKKAGTPARQIAVK